MNEFPTWLVSTLASDASEGQGVLPNTIHSLQSSLCIVGPARVVLISQDDNLAVRKVLETPPEPGSVLVVAGGSTSRAATIGSLMALEMQNAGIIGLVTDGLVRDAREIRELGFGVWCRGVTPIAPHRLGPACVGGSISLGSTIIQDGDLVIADDDGVVIWPQEHINELMIKAQTRLQQDNERLDELLKRKNAK
jgi:4-hydroxy-4-methyl-2-oxoglutarate aldolase